MHTLVQMQMYVTAGGSATLVLLSILVSNKTGASADVDVFLVTNTGDDVFLLEMHQYQLVLL